MNAYTHKHEQRRDISRSGISGFSMIEMMISITIGLMIVAALIGVLTSNSRSTKTNERTSEVQSNGRYAMDHLKRELRQARYRGYTWAEPNTPTTALTPMTNECLDGGAAGSFVSNIRQGIWGANDSTPYAANCLPAANQLRGDVLVIRRVANAATTTLVANTLYFRSTYAAGEVFKGTTAPAIAGTPVADFALQEDVYYIGNDTANAALPALRHITLKGNGDDCNGTAVTTATMCDEMVVSGIEHMEVQYGRLDTASNTQYSNANSIAGASTDSPTTLTSYAWDEVNSVRIWLLARNSKIENGYSNTNSYAMGDITYGPVNDSFRRQLFTAVVQLRN